MKNPCNQPGASRLAARRTRLRQFAAGFVLALAAHSTKATAAALVNPGFEGGGGGGDVWTAPDIKEFHFPGWEGRHADWILDWFGTSGNGGGSQGANYFAGISGGWLKTAADARVEVRPLQVYRLSLDVKKVRQTFAGSWRGLLVSLEFFDAKGEVLSRHRSAEILPEHAVTAADASTSMDSWQNFQFDAAAPEGSTKAGVFVEFPGVRNETNPNIYHGTISYLADNFVLAEVPEKTDTLTLHNAPPLIEPGRAAALRVRYTAPAAREVVFRLIRGTQSLGEVRRKAPPGRGVVEVFYPVPSTLPAGEDYRWECRLVPTGGRWETAVCGQQLKNVVLDQRGTGSSRIDPTDANLVYEGRWEKTDPRHPVMTWPGSALFARFAGTSVRLRVSPAGPQVFGGPFPQDVVFKAIIDDDVEHARDLVVRGQNTTLAVTGLPDGVHTLEFLKVSESNSWLVFHGLELDPKRGLLRCRPFLDRRIEFFGDSVTSGGDAGFLLSYGAITARELQADRHTISKGGTGVAGSFVFGYTLRDYFDKLDFDSFDPQKAKAWDFRQWQPQAVVIAIGQNDLFQAPEPKRESFRNAYRKFVEAIRERYPAAHLFCMNTVMSGDAAFFLQAITPILEDKTLNRDSKIHFRFNYPRGVENTNGNHPNIEQHRHMADGSVELYGLTRWISETLGW